MLEEDECVGGPYDGERRRQPAGLLSFGVYQRTLCGPGVTPVPGACLGSYVQDRTGAVNVWRWYPA